jgi:hypothetical protein
MRSLLAEAVETRRGAGDADAWLSEQRALWEARFDRFDALLEDTNDD